MVKKKTIKIKKTKQKEINFNSALLVIGILAIASMFIIMTIGNNINIQGNPVYPNWAAPVRKTSNVPYKNVKDYQFCHEYECKINCEDVFPGRKCEYKAKGTDPYKGCPIFEIKETGVSWQPHWKCE